MQNQGEKLKLKTMKIKSKAKFFPKSLKLMTANFHLFGTNVSLKSHLKQAFFDGPKKTQGEKNSKLEKKLKTQA